LRTFWTKNVLNGKITKGKDQAGNEGIDFRNSTRIKKKNCASFSV